MRGNPATTKWYKCTGCGNTSIHPVECCGQLMTDDHEENEEYMLDYNYAEE